MKIISLLVATMNNSNEDKVPPVIEGLIDEVHGGRKQDSKFWERDIDNSRNDFVGYTNGEIIMEKPVGLLQTLTQSKVKRAAVTVGIVILCCLISLVYLRPDLFSFLTSSKVYQTISEYFPDKERNEHPVKSVPAENDKEPREHTFSEEQILKAKKEILEARKNKPVLTGRETQKANSPIKPFQDANNIYEIQLLSGRYVYADSVIVTKDTVTFENKKGLVVSVNRDDVKSLKKMK